MTSVSVVLPCLNEEDGVGHAIQTIINVFREQSVAGEIIVVDNGSTDRTAEIVKQFPVKYIYEQKRGYGNAYLAGFREAVGTYVIMGDPDSSYNFKDIPRFLAELENHDAVLGSRFMGTMEKGAMPFLHRYVGNPGMLLLFRLLFGLTLTEPSTGFLGIHRDLISSLNLKEPGMEFSSEVLVRIKKQNFSLKEIPIDYTIRTGSSKLRTFRDGLRHFRFLLREKIYS